MLIIIIILFFKSTVLECSPPIDHLDEILSQLNTKRDFFMFLKKMRQAFYRHAQNDNN